MSDKVPFYGSISVPEDVLSKRDFSSIWKKALASYDEDKLEWGITSVYEAEEETAGEADRVAWQISGITEEGFDDATPWILQGSLEKNDAKKLYEALEKHEVELHFNINEYANPDNLEDSLTRETGTLTVKGGKVVLKDTDYQDVEITSQTLIDMGFATESEADDEELAVMLAAEYPDGPDANDLIDAISDVRNDNRHEGVFTQEETEDPVAFGQMIEAAPADEDDIG